MGGGGTAGAAAEAAAAGGRAGGARGGVCVTDGDKMLAPRASARVRACVALGLGGGTGSCEGPRRRDRSRELVICGGCGTL